VASIRDVAKMANVGVGTVSRALNGTGYVSADAKKRIDEAIQELGYTPNELAKNLFRNRSGIVGIVVPNLEHPFFARLSREIESCLYERGYKTMICNTIGISNREKDYLDMLDRNIVDGIITGAHSLDDSVYLKINKPIVALDRDFGRKIPLIHSDHEKGGRLAAMTLIEAGCKNVLQFATSSLVHTPSNKRHIEFEKICREHGVRVTTVETVWNNLEYEYFRNAMKDYMDIYEDIDGIFTADVAAAFCMNALKAKGRRIPQEVKVIGYDAVGIIYLTDPVMTSIAQNTTEISQRCVDTILKMIEGNKNYERQQIVDVALLKGDST